MKKSVEFDSPSLGKEIGGITRASHMFLRHQFNEFDIGHAQLMTLHYICRNDGISQNELVHYSNLDKSSITSQLNKLEQNGYIYRKINSDDSRGRRVFITDKTKEIEVTLHEKFLSWNKILIRGLDKEELECIFIILDKIKMNAQGAIQEIRDNEEKK